MYFQVPHRRGVRPQRENISPDDAPEKIQETKQMDNNTQLGIHFRKLQMVFLNLK